MAEVDGQIAELAHRSTHELRFAWRQLHRVEPPQGLSRDLLIRALAHQVQESANGGASRASRRRLQILSGKRDRDPARAVLGLRLCALARTREASINPS